MLLFEVLKVNQMKNAQLIPVHRDYRVSKSLLPNLPEVFKRVPDYMGDKKNALRQYHGPNGIHVLEYPYEWSFHRDYVNPRYDPIGHLVFDAPEIPVAGLLGLAAASTIYNKKKSLVESALAGGAIAFLTWIFLSELRKQTREERGPRGTIRRWS
jgi:hypothetical protein